MPLAVGTSLGARALAVFLALAVACPWPALAQGGGAQDQAFKPEELEQVVAPVALYPDPSWPRCSWRPRTPSRSWRQPGG